MLKGSCRTVFMGKPQLGVKRRVSFTNGHDLTYTGFIFIPLYWSHLEP
jgi:hypothetical protein